MKNFVHPELLPCAVSFVIACSTALMTPSLSAMDHPAIPRNDPNSKEAHRQLLAKTRQGKIDVYFAGDSITRRWGATDYPHLLAHWKKTFHGWNVANFAWGGDATQNILWRLRNGELEGVKPKVFILQAGTNNLPWQGPAHDSKVDEVVGGIQAIIAEFHRQVPDAPVILTALFPRTQNLSVKATIEAINLKLEKLGEAPAIHFININSQLGDESGRLRSGMSSDGLHLEKPGYEIWASALTPLLEKLMGPRASEDQAPPPTGNPAVSK